MNEAEERRENERQLAQMMSEQARAVLSNDAYRVAWDQIHKALMNSLLSCEETDEKARFAAWQAVRIARNLNGALSDMIETGESAKNAIEKQIEQQEKRRSARLPVA